MANRPVEGFPTSRHVDGDDITKAQKKGYSDINQGHTDWKDSQTKKAVEPPDWASDRD